MKHIFKKPSFYLISSATDGDEKAIEKILALYDPYISKCCLRSLYDEYGNVYIAEVHKKEFPCFFSVSILSDNFSQCLLQLSLTYIQIDIVLFSGNQTAS